MADKQKCALCKREAELAQSHIIPKFVSDWIKKTSATGYLFQVKDLKRVQDSKKIPLLCKECENKISKWEGYFASNVFIPYHDVDMKNFSLNYDENLIKFMISISWRILSVDIEDFKKINPEMAKYAETALEVWRNFLINEKNRGDYEHHIFLLSYVESATEDLHDKFQMYMLRGIDGTIVHNSRNVFIYMKFPGIMFISSIYPDALEGCEGTKIIEKGTLKTPQTIVMPCSYDFFTSRLAFLDKEPSKKQTEKIIENIKKNPERFLRSKTLRVFLEEKLRKLKNR
jgi:hypothetical protein